MDKNSFTDSEMESIKELREMINAKITEEGDQSIDSRDLPRINQNAWLNNYLVDNDFKMKEAFKHCWDTLQWRKENNLNEMTEKSVDPEYLTTGNIYMRGRDTEGHLLLYFRVRIYTRGNKTTEGLKTYLLYWFERGMRAANGEKVTVVLDMTNTGMKNMDLDYVHLMINLLKSYYPNVLSYILIYEMPWIMTGVFQIIKGLLPKKIVKQMLFIGSKNVQKYIDINNMPKEWGGLDDFELKFEPEVRPNEKKESGANNNDEEQTNLNLINRKVHFANLQESPMSDISSSSQFENHYGDMLQLSPAEIIVFQKNNNNEYFGNVEILNIGKKAITYKVKTTAPDKFRVRPSSGTLSPNNSATINVVIQKSQHTLPVNKDKFLVMCMSLPDGESLSNEEISNMWKEVTASSPDVEQHRLKCAMPSNVTTAIINNLEGISDSSTVTSSNMVHSTVTHNGTKQTTHTQQHIQATINQLSDSVHHMQQQVKTLQSLQWITIFVFIMLSISIVYILKMEIQNSNSQYCIDK